MISWTSVPVHMLSFPYLKTVYQYKHLQPPIECINVKPVLRDHCHERPPISYQEIPHISGRRCYISIQLNLSPKTTCLQRPLFYFQRGGLSRQVLLYYIYQVTHVLCRHTWPTANTLTIRIPTVSHKHHNGLTAGPRPAIQQVKGNIKTFPVKRFTPKKI